MPFFSENFGATSRWVGPNDPDVAAILNNLGVLHRKHGQYSQAQRYLARALAIKKTAFGSDHPEVALTLSNLAQVHVAQGRYEQAEPLLRLVVDIREKALGPTHLEVAGSLEQYAVLLRKLRRDEKATHIEARARGIRASSGK